MPALARLFRRLAFTALPIALLATSTTLEAHAALWEVAAESSIPETGRRPLAPHAYRTYAADLDELRSILATAPSEAAGVRPDASQTLVDLPMPDGSHATFRVVESPVMAPELAAKYPEIRTYLGVGVTDPTATVRFDVVPSGFHAQIFTPSGTVYIDPYQQGDTRHHLSYHRRDAARAEGFEAGSVITECTLEATADELDAAHTRASSAATSRAGQTGGVLRTYRAAIAAPGEYTLFHGGTVPDALAALAVALNRINGVLERELAVRLELVANNDEIVYTDPATDPFSPPGTIALAEECQSVCDDVIGQANYDLGHVFSAGSGGGVSWLGTVCDNGRKAKSASFLGSPVGDGFLIYIVAHEMGHQFGATHTFNGNEGGCGISGQRTASSAWEPGSGSTIMSYAGVCGSQSIQGYKDDYYHTGSLAQMVSYTEQTNCAAETSTGNTPPVATVDRPFTFTHIPIDTPFALTGAGTDSDGDELSYGWEQYDRGPAGHPDDPANDAPIFRSFLPASSPTRVFPRWSDIVDDTHTIGELLPTYARTLTFRFTVRDNAVGGGGHHHDQLDFEADDTAGPFLVTFPNGGETLNTSSASHTITWDVANTTNANVNCQAVDILLSKDGGYTYPVTLLAGTPNDGSAEVTIASGDETTTGRIMVRAADNVFFDISDGDLVVTTAVAVDGPVGVPSNERLELLGSRPNPFNPFTRISFNVPRSTHVSLRIFDGGGRLVSVLVDERLPAGVHARAWEGLDSHGHPLSSGIFFAELAADGVSEVLRLVLAK